MFSNCRQKICSNTIIAQQIIVFQATFDLPNTIICRTRLRNLWLLSNPQSSKLHHFTPTKSQLIPIADENKAVYWIKIVVAQIKVFRWGKKWWTKLLSVERKVSISSLPRRLIYNSRVVNIKNDGTSKKKKKNQLFLWLPSLASRLGCVALTSYSTCRVAFLYSCDSLLRVWIPMCRLICQTQ